MPTDYSYLFQTPEGLIDARTVDLGATFQGVQNQNQLNNSIAWHNGITAGLGVLNGVNGILGTSMRAAQINENPEFNVQLNDLRDYATRDYDNYEQLSEDMSRMNTGFQQDYGKVRGMTNGQRWGAVGSSALAGAAAGSQFGWIGSLVGGAIGAGAGILGVKTGDNRAGIQTRYDNAQVGLARNNALATAASEHENIADFNHRGLASHVVRNGGQINTQTRQENIQQFANRVLGKKSNLPTRTYCKGGVMVKVKMK